MMWQDLLLNLLSEVIGILVTVFLVDKLIKRREEKRNERSKSLSYAMLFNLTTELLDMIVPESSTGKVEHAYMFDLFPVTSQEYGSFPSKKFVQMQHEEISRFAKHFEHLDISKIRGIKREIDSLILRTAYLIESDLRSMLTALDWSISSLSNLEDVDEEKKDILFVVTFFAIIQAALGVRKILKTKAKRVSFDELAKRIPFPAKDLKNIQSYISQDDVDR